MRFLVNCLIFGFVLTVPLQACADQFYMTVSYECGLKPAMLRIFFNGAWNSKGEALGAELKNGWRTEDLATFDLDENGRYIIHELHKSVNCRLKGREYNIIVSPAVPPGYYPDGYCGARMGALVRVLLKNKLLVSRSVDGCTASGTVTTEIIIFPDKFPIYKEMESRAFYEPN